MKYFLLAFAVLLSYSVVVDAQPGTLDKSFGIQGAVINQNTNAIGISSAIQEDDKVIVGGLTLNNVYILIRYLTDGTIDSSFGDDGKAVTAALQQ